MKIQYGSDLHLEFKENKAFLKAAPILPTGDILILAGDITPFPFMDEHKDFFRYLANYFETVCWLPGNHEYYHSDAAQRSDTLNEKIKPNVFLVNNITIFRSDVRFLFSTLWSKIDPANEWQIERSVSDFGAISYNGYRFSAPAFNLLHQRCLNFLSAEFQKEYAGKPLL
jgi:Icc-related predicted phosphoesterase